MSRVTMEKQTTFKLLEFTPAMISIDIAFHVLSCLPNKTLLQMRLVSKEWNDLISSPSFIQLQKRKNQSEISGFFFQPKFHWCKEDIKSFSYISMNPDFQAKSMVFDFLSEDVVVLSACNGLICCRSCLPSQDPLIYVCNPLNRNWASFKLLPQNDTDKLISIALVFDPARICTNFKVVTLILSRESHYEFEIYDSKKEIWKKSTERCLSTNLTVSKKQSVYNEGILHWLTDDGQVLTFDVEKEFCLIVSVPVPLMAFEGEPESCIGESEDELNYILVSDEGIHIWCLENYFEFQWKLRISKSLKAMEEEEAELFLNLQGRVKEMKRWGMEASSWVDPLAFKNGILVMRVGSKLYVYKVETGEIMGVVHLSLLGPNSMAAPTVLPYSMTLLTFKDHSLPFSS